MRIAVCTIAYNEEWSIAAVIENWRGLTDHHCVLLGSQPWHGDSLPKDHTEEIAKENGAEVISLPWPSERSQRNWGLGYLYNYDYVLMIDADELFERADQEKILGSLGTTCGEFRVDNMNCYRVPQIVTYFKTPEYVIDPPDSHEPLIAIDPKKATFRDYRIPSQDYMLPIEGTKMHHVTFLRPDERLRSKLAQFEHHDQVKPEWFEKTWGKWTPDMEDVHAYKKERSKAVLFSMPEEIRALLRYAQEQLAAVSG